MARDTNDLPDYLLGEPLTRVLSTMCSAITAGHMHTQALYRNQITGGWFTLEAKSANTQLNDYPGIRVASAGLIDTKDEKTLLALLHNRVSLAAFEDWLVNDIQAELTSDITDLLLTCLEDTLSSAINEISRLTPPTPEVQTDMPLRGTLPACLKYMALQFSQHGYEFLNIAYNMETHEYELLTNAEADKLHKLGTWGDRRMVLTCSAFEITTILATASPQLTIPGFDNADTQTS